MERMNNERWLWIYSEKYEHAAAEDAAGLWPFESAEGQREPLPVHGRWAEDRVPIARYYQVTPKILFEHRFRIVSDSIHLRRRLLIGSDRAAIIISFFRLLVD